MNALVQRAAEHPWNVVNASDLQHEIRREDERHTSMVAVSLNR